MASLIKKIKKGHSYYYAFESARVNGKPRIVWQKYLGTLDSIIKQYEKSRPAAPKEAVLFEVGAVATLLRITKPLCVLEIGTNKPYLKDCGVIQKLCFPHSVSGIIWTA